MQTRQNTGAKGGQRKLPAWAGWLIGWAAVLAAAAALVYFWRAAFLLDSLPQLPFTLGAAGLFSLVYLGVFLLSRIREKGRAGRAALLVFLFGLLFCFASAPLQAPDEHNHYLRAWSISAGRFTYDYNERYPEDVALLFKHFPPQINHAVSYQNQAMAPARLAAYQNDIQAAYTSNSDISPPTVFMLLPYLPQALFMALARAFGFSALGLLYAGRIANLAVYSLLCWLAFRGAARWRGILYAAALLPLSLFMAASCNYDGLMLGLCYCLIGFVCREEIDNRGLAFFIAAAAAAVYIKPNNFLFAGLLFAVPKSRWKAAPGRAAALGLCIAAMALLYFGLGQGIDGGPLRQNWPQQALLDIRGSGNDPAPKAQFMYILGYPFKFAAIALLSVLEANAFLFDMGRLGGMDLTLPLVGGLSALVLLAASSLSARPGSTLGKKTTAGLFGLALLYSAAILAGMYVTDTDKWAVRISGLQPRYFLPGFLLLFLLCAAALGRLAAQEKSPIAAQRAQEQKELLCLRLCGGVAAAAAVLLFQSYYIGQWLPKAEGGWRLVNMLGGAA